jgi:hypothetical protein
MKRPAMVHSRFEVLPTLVPVVFALLLSLCACSKQVPSVPLVGLMLPPKLDAYFERYCEYTGGLGIGLDPAHTYDFRFRQHLKETKDLELKRLFVLENLYREVESDLRNFEDGMLRVAKASSRPFTQGEWNDARQSLLTRLDDLAQYAAFTNYASPPKNLLYVTDFSPQLDKLWVEVMRQKIRDATNAPAGLIAPAGGAL